MTSARRCPATTRRGLCGEVYGCLGCSAQCGRCARTIRRIMNEALAGADAACCRATATPSFHNLQCDPYALATAPLRIRRIGYNHYNLGVRIPCVRYCRRARSCEASRESSTISTRRSGTNSPRSTNTGCITACWTIGATRTLAKQWRKESIEEMEHADKLVERIIFLDGFPNMQVLDPLHIGQTVKEVLDCDLRGRDARARALRGSRDPLPCGKGLRLARPVREADERRGSITSTSSRLSLIWSPSSGVELYAQHHIGKLDDDHD